MRKSQISHTVQQVFPELKQTDFQKLADKYNTRLNLEESTTKGSLVLYFNLNEKTYTIEDIHGNKGIPDYFKRDVLNWIKTSIGNTLIFYSAKVKGEFGFFYFKINDNKRYTDFMIRTSSKRKLAFSFQNYAQGSFEKIKPNNIKVQQVLKQELKGDIINAYNLYDYDGETVGIICTRIVREQGIAGCQVIFIPIGEDGYYNFQGNEIKCDLVFSCNDKGQWVYSKEDTGANYMKHLSVTEGETNYILNKVEGKTAIPRVIEKVSNFIEKYYKSALKIDKAYNNIVF